MQRRARAALAIGALASLFAAASCTHDPDETRAPSVSLSPCRVNGIDTEVRCTDVDVPEDRDAPVDAQASRIRIHVAVVPALVRVRRPDPVFVVAGGPGQSAISVAGAVMPLFSKLNRERDIVFVDQRGTGKSHPLTCPEPKGATSLAQQLDLQYSLKLLRECAAQLTVKGDDTRHYLTVDAVRDLDDVRAALGYARINLWGASYGTRVELDYLRQFPAHVRVAVLDGVAPADMRLPVSFAIDADSSLDRLIAACRADLACTAAHPDLGARIDQLFARLRAGPIHADMIHPLTGRHESVDITLGDFASWLRSPLYNSVVASLVPQAIAGAAEGNFGVLAAANISLGDADGNAFSMGMHLSVVCGEDMTRVDQADLDRIAKTRFGRAFYDQYQALCQTWSTRAAPPEFFSVPDNTVPVLMFDGGVDPATPPRHALPLLEHLHGAHLLTAPHLGHGVSMQGCAPELIERFIKNASAAGIDGGCLADIPRPPFFEPIAQAHP